MSSWAFDRWRWEGEAGRNPITHPSRGYFCPHLLTLLPSLTHVPTQTFVEQHGIHFVRILTTVGGLFVLLFVWKD